MNHDLTYRSMLEDILTNGVESDDRTGTGTRSVFGRQYRFNFKEGFPLLTTKKMFWKGIVAELLWMLSGSTNIKPLVDQGVHIWDEWANEDGELGPVYGKQWRSWSNVKVTRDDNKGYTFNFVAIDQIKDVIERIKTKPNDRRLIVTAWNPSDISEMKLPPCHCFFQFYVRGGRLSCQLYQRSADVFLGVPFNIASYALLTILIARECDLGLGEFVHTFGDLHLYKNHIEQAKEQIKREPFPTPTISIGRKPLFELTTSDIELLNYECHPAIKAEVSV